MYIDAGHLKYFFLRLLNNWKDEGDPIEGTLRMSPSGKVYLTAYSDDERFLLGNFNSGNLRQLLRSSAIRNLFREINEHSAGSPRCKDCSSWAICGGGSRVRAYAMHKSFDEPDEFCEAKRVFLGRWFRALLEGV
jgi:radical SAM protein with 4Fe4S-binding SPASM domain